MGEYIEKMEFKKPRGNVGRRAENAEAYIGCMSESIEK
jgi:hypothetical protein